MTKPKAINHKKLVAFVLLICKTDNCHGNLEIEYAGTGIREQAVIVHDACERLLPENFSGGSGGAFRKNGETVKTNWPVV